MNPVLGRRCRDPSSSHLHATWPSQTRSSRCPSRYTPSGRDRRAHNPSLAEHRKQTRLCIACIALVKAPSSGEAGPGTTSLKTSLACDAQESRPSFARARRGRRACVLLRFGISFGTCRTHRSSTRLFVASRRSHHLRVHKLRGPRRGNRASNRSGPHTQSPSSPVLNVVIFFECVVRRLFVVQHIGPVLVMCIYLH